MGKRVLITGLATFWGGRVAQALEADPDVDVIVGLDRFEPTVQLERTEYVRSDERYSILARIVKAARIDTIVHTFLVVDSTQMASRTMHEINVIGTMNLFAAASAQDSTVRDVVVKSSTLVYGAGSRDPNVFREESTRTTPPRTPVERSLLEVEGYVRDFAEDN
ncbi:MAG: NAD-dependent epimerase/dehydratase family protein, partial [Acidimicrobiales bacterium]